MTNNNGRRGYAVQVTRDDGTTFIAGGSDGILPAIYTRAQRKQATTFKRYLLNNGIYPAKVVRVRFFNPVVES